MVLSQFSSVQSAVGAESPSIPALLKHSQSPKVAMVFDHGFIGTFRDIAFNKIASASKSVRLCIVSGFHANLQ
jgi:hypothetical protein